MNTSSSTQIPQPWPGPGWVAHPWYPGRWTRTVQPPMWQPQAGEDPDARSRAYARQRERERELVAQQHADDERERAERAASWQAAVDAQHAGNVWHRPWERVDFSQWSPEGSGPGQGQQRQGQPAPGSLLAQQQAARERLDRWHQYQQSSEGQRHFRDVAAPPEWFQ